MKQARRIALMTHPDKSSLPTEVYEFYNQAYKILEEVYKVGHRNCDRVYNKDKYIDEEGNDSLWKAIGKSDDFSEKFNEIFDEYKERIKTKDDGYGDWLAEQPEECTKATSIRDMHELMSIKKKSLGAIIEAPTVEGINGGHNNHEISGNAYNKSGMFASLEFDDIKNAYQQSVMPDYGPGPPRATTIEELEMQRGNDMIRGMKDMRGKEMLNEYHRQEFTDNMSNVYKMAKSNEITKRVLNKLSTRYLQIVEK